MYVGLEVNKKEVLKSKSKINRHVFYWIYDLQSKVYWEYNKKILVGSMYIFLLKIINLHLITFWWTL